MAQGDITAKLTDAHIDLSANRLTAHIERYQEDSDGTKNSVGGADVSITVPDWSLYIKAQLKIDIIAAAKAQNPKIPAQVS
jgi:hypothetical protein